MHYMNYYGNIFHHITMIKVPWGGYENEKEGQNDSSTEDGCCEQACLGICP